MQIAINISEDDYELACKYPEVLFGSYAKAIKNGIVLEPHGRLIDADRIDDTYKSCADMLSNEELVGASIVKLWINDAPTILEPTVT